MSLLQTRWLTVGAATVLAIWAPLRLSDPEVEVPPATTVEQARAVRLPDPPTLDAALTSTAPMTDPVIDPALAGNDTATPSAPPLPPGPALVGTALGGRGKAVALVRGSSGQVVTLARGGSVDGWRLTHISRGEARFVQDGNAHVAKIDLANRPTQNNPPAATAPLASLPEDSSQ